jgi:hypothetical protein
MGHGPAGAGPAPRAPADVLADLIRDLGMDGRRLPAGVDRRAAALRTRLADRRILVVLDDAASVDQITPPLHGTASCGVLVTGRRWLGGLASVRSVRLEPLGRTAALTLLATAAGGERVSADRRSAAQVVAACGSLPLAVRIAGARLARGPALSLDRLARRLADDQGRLDELSIGEVTVRAGLRLSYEAQPPDAQRLLAALGALSTPVVPAWALPTLLPDRAAAAVELAAEELTASSLVTSTTSAYTGEPRLALHDLVRLYAAELAGPEAPAAVLAELLPAAIELAGQAVARMPWPANMLPAWCPAPTPGRTPDATVARADPAGWLADERRRCSRRTTTATAPATSGTCGASRWPAPVTGEVPGDLLRTAHAMLVAVGDVRGVTLAARDLAALTVDDDPGSAALALRACVETFHLAGMARYEAVAARLLAVALRRLGESDAAAVAVTRADALEPPGNANTTRLLEILVGPIVATYR